MSRIGWSFSLPQSANISVAGGPVGRSRSAEIDAHKEQAERAVADQGEAPICHRIAAEMPAVS